MLVTIHAGRDTEPALAYDLDAGSWPAFLKAVDGAAKEAGAAPVALLDMGEPGAVHPTELNAAWLDGIPAMLAEADGALRTAGSHGADAAE